MFPPLRLLLGLKDEEQTPAAHALVAAAAAPAGGGASDRGAGRSAAGPGAASCRATGPLVLVVDNGWTAAKDWDARQALIADLLRSAQATPRRHRAHRRRRRR